METDARVFTALEELLHVLREALISYGPTPDANVQPIGRPDRFPSQQAAGETQELELRVSFSGQRLPHLTSRCRGLGAENPVASLFPGSPGLT
jgi:Glucosamine-6-phosphate isomerases/6-phosphogluconolactonase